MSLTASLAAQPQGLSLWGSEDISGDTRTSHALGTLVTGKRGENPKVKPGCLSGAKLTKGRGAFLGSDTGTRGTWLSMTECLGT